jgi:hypothetical protein
LEQTGPIYDGTVAAKLIAPPRPSPARSDRDDPPGRSRPRINSTFGSIGFLVVVVMLWIVSLARLQLTAIGAYGLVSALPVTMYAGLALLTVSMVMAIHRGERSAVLAAHLVLFVLMVHATPALLYTTLRYAWAWKHLGLVDYLARHHAVTHAGGDLSVYQNWPGFFTASTSWLVGSGVAPSSWPAMAQWAPPVFELLFSFSVLALLSAMEADRRLVWLSVWFFAIGNWVGQDYFSPQAYAYFLYLAVLVIVFRWLARRPPMPIFLRGFVRDWPDPEETDDTRETSPEHTRAGTIIVLICVTAIATSHPLTPLVLFVALTALALTRVLRVRSLPLMAAVPTFLWLEVGARSYTNAEVPGLVTKVGSLDTNVSQTLAKASNAAASQRLVSTFGRVEVAFLVLLALIGVVRRIRNGHWDLGAIVLGVIPGTILVGGSYGGEAIFRVYLFALPFLAYFAAAAFYPTKDLVRKRSSWLVAVSSLVIVTTFLFSYYGKEAWSYFAPGEVRAAKLIFDHAKPNSLLVEGTSDFPTHFANYTDFEYVDISNEPPNSFTRILANPVGDLRNWLADPQFSHAYLIITAAQKAQSDALGSLPVGSLDRIENALRKSPVFRVLYYDRDAVVFTLASASRTQVPTPSPTPKPNPKR